MKMFNKKKGDLAIGVNAIVILIIAVVVLGLILAFIRGAFTKVGDQLTNLAENEPDPAPATASNPITLSRDTANVETNKNFVIKTAVLCMKTATDCTSIQPVVTCTAGVADTVSTKSIKMGSSQVFIINLKAAAAATTEVCSVGVEGIDDAGTLSYSSDFVVKVK